MRSTQTLQAVTQAAKKVSVATTSASELKSRGTTWTAPSRRATMSKRRKPQAARTTPTAAAPAPAAPAAATAPVDVADVSKPELVTSGRVLGLLSVQAVALGVGLRIVPSVTAGVRLDLDLLSLLSPLIEAPLPTMLGTIAVMLPTQLFVGAQMRQWQSNGAKVAFEPAVRRLSVPWQAERCSHYSMLYS